MTDSFLDICDECGSDLSSRVCARELRAEILQDVASGHRVVLDFGDVRTLSESFADELLAVLVATKGESWFRENIEIVNLDEENWLTILEAIQNRLDSGLAV